MNAESEQDEDAFFIIRTRRSLTYIPRVSRFQDKTAASSGKGRIKNNKKETHIKKGINDHGRENTSICVCHLHTFF